MSTTELLTQAEARAYVKVGSESSFQRFCKRAQVRPVSFGLFATVHLENGVRRLIRNTRAKA